MAFDEGFGGLASWLASRRTAGTDASNYLDIDADTRNAANQSLKDLLNFHGSDAATDPLKSSQIATQEVQNNPVLSKLFGNGGALDRANTEEQNLASRGYSLQPEDYEAYGQASGNIARMFDSSQGGLAQALANRGLSTSGVANQAFANSQGNKLEQLGQLQTQIAQRRMQMNMERLNNTRQFMSQLGGEANNAINSQFGRQQDAERLKFGEMQAQNQAGFQRLSGAQNQANEQLSQRMATQQIPGWAMAGMGSIQGLQNQDAQAKQMGQQVFSTLGKGMVAG